MARINRIPEPYQAGLRYILTVSDKEFHDLIDVLAKVPPSLISRADIKQSTPKTTIIAREKAVAIIEAAFSMLMTSLANDVSTEQFIEDVAEALGRGLV